MTTINTHQGVNIDGGWIIYRNSINAFRIVLTGLDTTSIVFSMEFYTPGGTTPKLTLTESDGEIVNDDAGTIDYTLSVDNIETLPRDRYFFVIKYTTDGETYPLAQGYTNITIETNPGSTTTSVTIPVSVSSTQINMSVTMIGGPTSAEVLEMVNNAVGNAEISAGIEVNVAAYGAVGDGATDDKTAITNAITAAGIGGVVSLTPGKVYLTKGTLRFLDQQRVRGNGATIKRCNAITTTLTVAAADAATTITVADATKFAVGDTIMIIDSTSPFGGTGRRENSLAGSTNSTPQAITLINGNVITLDNGGVNLPANGNLNTAGQFPIGATVLKHFDLISVSSANTNNLFENLVVDGNKANNSLTYSWVVNPNFTATGSNCRVVGCVFKNAPNENIFINNYSTIEDCYGYDLNGSFAHVTNTVAADYDGNNFIINNKLRNVCIISSTISEHNEGAITFSALAQKTFIIGNTLDTCGNAFAAKLSGGVASPDFDVYIRNNTVSNTNGVFEAEGDDQTLENIHITNNQFVNCKWLVIGSYSTDDYVWNGTGMDNIIITGNRFVDTRIYLIQCTGIHISNNNFKFTTQAVAATKITGASTTNAITLKWCENANIVGNILEDLHTTEDANLLGAISFASDGASFIGLIKSDASTNTKYSYGGRNILIANNQIIGFSAGITDRIDAGNPDGTFSYIAVNITNNTIVLRADADAMYGIRALSGVTVNANKIYGDSNALYGILAAGTSSANSAALNGSIVYDNIIYGITISIRVAVSGTPTAKYNARVYNNFVTGTVTDNTGGSSTASGNVTIINEAPILQLVRLHPDWY